MGTRLGTVEDFVVMANLDSQLKTSSREERTTPSFFCWRSAWCAGMGTLVLTMSLC